MSDSEENVRFLNFYDLPLTHKWAGAMVEQAITDYISQKHLQIYNSAKRWIYSDSEEDFFSFRWACDTIGVSPGFARRYIEDQRKTYQKGNADGHFIHQD